MTVNVTIDGRAAEMTVESLSGALGLFFGEAAVHLGRAWGDWAAYYRFRQIVSITEKVKKIREEYPTAPEFKRELGDGEGIRAMEAASTEDDENVQDLWAGLIRNASDTRTQVTIEKPFLDLLRSLTGPDALLLRAIYEIHPIARKIEDNQRIWQESYMTERSRHVFGASAAIDDNPPSAEHDLYSIAEKLEEWRKIDKEIAANALNNLFRLRLITAAEVRYSGFSITKKLYLGENMSDRIEFLTPDALHSIQESINKSAGVVEHYLLDPRKLEKDSKFTVFEYFPELQYKLTPLGGRLMRACDGSILPAETVKGAQ